MQHPIAIKQEEWDSPFLSVARQDNLSHFIDTHSLLKRSSLLNQQLHRCKFCKAFPFSMCGPFKETEMKECEMCGSINEYQMRYSLLQPVQEAYFTSHSYILPTNNATPTSNSIILFITALEKQEIHHLAEALKVITESLTIQTSVLLVVHGKLAIVDFVDNPQLVVLSKDIDIRQKIEETRCQLTPQMVEQLLAILLALNQQPIEVKKMNQIAAFQLLEAVAASFQENRTNSIQILLWVGKFPMMPKSIRKNSLIIIAILIINHKMENVGQLMDLHRQLTQVYYLAPKDAATKLYYKLHETLTLDHLGCICSGVITLRTDKQYSGNKRNSPDKLINADSVPIEVIFNDIAKYKMQICLEYTDHEGKHFKFIANCQQSEKRKRVMWLQRTMMMSRALNFVEQVYINFRKEGNDPGFDYFFIASQLQKFGQQFENNTELYRQILNHMSNYFKDFQKDAQKIFLPFGLMGKKQLLFVFYPLWQGGILHHIDRMWVGEDGEDNVEWCMQLLGTSFSVRQKHIPVFYQLCMDKEAYCFVSQ